MPIKNWRSMTIQNLDGHSLLITWEYYHAYNQTFT